MSSSFVDLNQVDAGYTVGSFFAHTFKPVLTNVSLKLNQGDHVTLFGPPASGKTTLLRLLAGQLTPARGTVLVNGQTPTGRLAPVPTGPHSRTEAVERHIARLAASDSPLILLDDLADELGPDDMRSYLAGSLKHRTVVIATRSAECAEALDLPVALIHNNTLAHHGTREDIAGHLSLPRVVDVWLEGVRYDLFRQLKRHPGVAEARLLPDGRFSGQRLRLVLKNGRYLPAVYDLVSRAPLLRVAELPVALTDILRHLPRK